MLRCIRCGACMNHCVVYRQIGGHAYGAVYPGPMGAVLTPAFNGLAKVARPAARLHHERPLPEVCPVDIPLPDAAPRLARPELARGAGAGRCAHGLGLWAFVAGRPALYRLGTAVSVRAMRLFRRGGWIRSLPLAGGWTAHRDFPAPAGKTFMELYRRAAAGREAREQRASQHPRRRPAGLGGGRREPGAIAAEAASLLASPELIRPRLPDTALVELFA